MTEEELIHWAAYYENKREEEKRALFEIYEEIDGSTPDRVECIMNFMENKFFFDLEEVRKDERTAFIRAFSIHESFAKLLRMDGLIDGAECEELHGKLSLCMQWQGARFYEGDVVWLSPTSVFYCDAFFFAP